MPTDAHGLPLAGSDEAVRAYDRAVDHLLRFQLEVVEAAADSVAADPRFAMGGILTAYLALLSTEGAAVSGARKALDAVAGDEARLLPRERAHLTAARRWAAGDMRAAGALLDEITVVHPHDVLALAVGHQIDFFTGDAVNLRDRVGRVLARWDIHDPHYGYLLGMYAFGLEECNLYGLSGEAGQEALERHPDDVWGIHAVAHTYEMQGQVPEGIRFMRQRETQWSQGNFLNVHNAWHFALYLLEAGDIAGALRVYDGVLHPEGAEDVALELLDATALLWRLHLEGVPAGGRWTSLRDAWMRSLVPGFYPFNDMHAVMALVGAGDLGRARELITALEHISQRPDPADTGALMTSSVGVGVCRGLLCFGEGDWDGAIRQLVPVRGRLHTFGGSHAQRDVVARTLLEAALRARRSDLAHALVSERLGVREASAYAWSKRAAILEAVDDGPGMHTALARAGQLREAARLQVA